MHLRDTIILLLAQHATLGLLYSRSPTVTQLFTKYSTTFALSALVSCSLFRLVRYSFDRNSNRRGSGAWAQRGCSGAGACFVRVGADDHDLNANANPELEQPKAYCSQAQQETSVFSHAVSAGLLSRLASMSHSLSEGRCGLLKQAARLRHMLGLILALFQYALLVGKRLRFLSAVVSEQQRKLSQLLVAHLELQSRYLNLMTISVQSRESIQRLREDLGCEASERSKAPDAHSRLTLEAEAVIKDCGFYETLAWDVVARFDGLKTEYGRLLVAVDLLKKDYVNFHKNLKEAASIVQATQDAATLGLVDLQMATCLRPLTFKQFIMRISQGLELFRFDSYDVIVQAWLTINRDMGRMVAIPSVEAPPVSGSVEDTVMKLKAIYENQTTSRNSKNASEGNRCGGRALDSGYLFQQGKGIIDKLTVDNLPGIAASMGRKLTSDTNLRPSKLISTNYEDQFIEEGGKMATVASIRKVLINVLLAKKLTPIQYEVILLTKRVAVRT